MTTSVVGSFVSPCTCGGTGGKPHVHAHGMHFHVCARVMMCHMCVIMVDICGQALC